MRRILLVAFALAFAGAAAAESLPRTADLGKPTEKNIAQVVRGKTTQQEVRKLLGPPWQPETYPLSKRTAWTYPMRIPSDPMPKWFVVVMTPDGVVRETYLMNDPQYDPPLGAGRRH